MKYILSILACLMICQVSFSQNNLSETANAEQTKKDIQSYAEFLKKEEFYSSMKEYDDAIIALDSKDYTKAMKLLKAAAAKGNPIAELIVGGMYLGGKGVKKNESEAIKWYLKSANNGLMYALYEVSEIYYEKRATDTTVLKVRFNTLLRCADAGCDDCFSWLALAYQEGQGVKVDYSKAVKWYKMIADKGNYVHMEAIARLYDDGGNGLIQSKEETFKWYMKAATANMYEDKPFAGSKRAMYFLYQMYNEGEGVKKNNVEAFKWLLKLGEIKEKQSLYEEDWIGDAIYDLGNAYYTGTGVEQNYSEALKWFTHGAELRISPLAMIKEKNPCMLKLATMYREGQGVKKDLKIAEEWQQKANESFYGLDD